VWLRREELGLVQKDRETFGSALALTA
jgi:hypothetical protein